MEFGLGTAAGLLVGLGFFWWLGAYTRLKRLRQDVQQCFVNLEAWFGRYQVLVQEAITAAATSPHGWRTQMAPELSVSLWTRLQVASSHAAVALARMSENPLSRNLALNLMAAESDLNTSWLNLVNPDNYYVHMPDELKQRWLELRVLIQPDMERFNESVRAYNAAIAMPPAKWLAKALGWRPAHILQ